MKSIAIIGAGGFAREVEWLIKDISAAGDSYDFLGYLVSDRSKLGPHDSPVLGELEWLHDHPVDCLAVGIGSPSVRSVLPEELKKSFPDIQWPPLVHPSVKMDKRTCSIGEGALLCAGVIATVQIRFDAFCLVNLSCTIGHEAIIGKGSVLNPTVNISGGVTIGDGVLIGTGAQVLQYLKVGDGASVGAGAVVTKNVPNGITVVGVPAKPFG
jgi:sugar O-acyltransferase (sialic acid O-acetyltransferase NeuD family)